MLVVLRGGDELQHRAFRQLRDYLRPGDLLVVNDSRVLRARLRGQRASTGGGVELLLLERQPAPGSAHDHWSTLARPARKLQPGERLTFGDGHLHGVVTEVREGGERVVQFETKDLIPQLDTLGEMPLPPYIVQRRRQTGGASITDTDSERYQTVYAQDAGSVAAPTAGLHFTQGQLDELQELGVERAHVTLHVGAGTFKPVEAEDPGSHSMHTEHYTVPPATAALVNQARAEGRRVIAVGTTVVRTLESAVDPASGQLREGPGSTQLLILPGYQFRLVDALLTNFHLPKSTLLMLVSAFAGTELVRAAYATAIQERYRFYSYGDAMLIV